MSTLALPTDHLPNDAPVCLGTEQTWKHLREACRRFAQQNAVLWTLRSGDGRLDGAEIEMQRAGVVRFRRVWSVEESLRLVVGLGQRDVLISAAGEAQIPQ